MADRIFNLPQTRGSFEMAGKVTGTQRSNFYNEKETKNGAMRRVLSFGVQTSNKNTFYVDPWRRTLPARAPSPTPPSRWA